MTETQSVNQQTQQENKQNDKDYNFRALEAKHRKEIEQERQARFDLERRLQEVEASKIKRNDDDDDQEDDSEPYVDHKRLKKQFGSFERKLDDKIQKKIQEEARSLLQKKEEDDWIRNNPDFVEVLNEQNLTRFVEKAKPLAESIKNIPDGFEKQKLVYNAIKSMGIDKPEQKVPSIQEKIDANRRSPYYQSSGVSTPPYAGAGDFSAAGQKTAYAKMQELKARLQR